MHINITTEHDENVVIMAEREWESMKVLISTDAPELVEKLKALNITVTVVGYPDADTAEGYVPNEGEVVCDLGEVTVTPDGLGLYEATVKPVTLRLLAIADTDVERDAEGRLTFTGAELRAYFTREEWTPRDGRFYTDKAVSDQVRAYISEKLGGVADVCSWSEAGLQGRDYAHFDLFYDTLEKIFPDVPALKLIDPEHANARPAYLGPREADEE